MRPTDPRAGLEPTVASPGAPTGAPAGGAPSGAPAGDGPIPGRVGRFRVLRRLGAGGMGVVYLARDETLGREVAVKVLTRELGASSSGQAFLLREAQSLARLSHPHVVTVHEAGEHEGSVFLAMEYVRGVTLRAWAQAAPRAWREVAAMCLQAARGLAAAHAVGLVHRDFKPDNVLLGEDGRVRVADFGLARPLAGGAAGATPDGSTAAQLSAPGAILGTPAYMAPEQAQGGAVDARADVFAFGVSLHELLAGHRPFPGETPVAQLIAVARDAPEPLERAAPHAPARLAQVVARCLEKDPARRFPSAAELEAELEAIVATSDDATRAGPPARPARRLAHVALAGSLVLALAAVSAVAVVAGRRPSPDADRPALTAPPSADAASPSAPAAVHDRVVPGVQDCNDYALSPDGQAVALIQDGKLLSVRRDGSGARELGPASGGLIAWLSDDRIVYADDNVLVVHEPGGAERRVTLPEDLVLISGGRISPDERHVALVSPQALYLVDLARAEVRTALQAPSGEMLHEAAWSPDAEELAVVHSTRTPGLDREIWIDLRSLDGSRSRRLLADPAIGPLANGYTGLFYLDARTIAYTVIRVGEDERTVLLARAIDGGEPRELHSWPAAPSVRFRGRTPGLGLVYESADLLTRVHVGELGPAGLAGVAPLESRHEMSLGPRWLDERTLAFHSRRGGAPGLWRLALGAERATRLTPVEHKVSHPGVLPGGGLLYNRRVDGTPPSFELIVTGPGGISPRAIAAGPEELDVQCTVRCVQRLRAGGALAYVAFDLESGRSGAVLHRRGASTAMGDWRLSPDGTRVAQVERFVPGVLLIDLATGVARELPWRDPDVVGQFLSWRPDGRRLVLSGLREARSELLEIGLDGAARTLFSDDDWLSEVSVSPDGKRIAFSRRPTTCQVRALSLP